MAVLVVQIYTCHYCVCLSIGILGPEAFLAELKEAFSKVKDLGLFSLRSLKKDSGRTALISVGFICANS